VGHGGKVFLSASTDAVDAALICKDRVVRDFSAISGTPLEALGAIGDSSNDLPFLLIDGLGLTGAPRNAQEAVRSALRNRTNGIVTRNEFFNGFMEFYRLARKRHISHVFADRDGVLIWNDENSHAARLHDVFEHMGLEGNPFIFILTGSSYEQNVAFLEAYGIGRTLLCNPCIRAHPYVLLAENGAVQFDVISGRCREFSGTVDPTLLHSLKSDFQSQVLRAVEEQVLPAFGLSWSDNPGDQVEKVYVPNKRTMVTINLPRAFRDGTDYRRSPTGDRLRIALLSAMVHAAKSLNLPYTRL